MSSLQDLLEVPFQSRSAEEQNAIIRKGKPLPSFDDQFTDSSKRFLSLKLVQHEWLVLGEKSKVFCWPCVLAQQGDSKWILDGVDAAKLTSDAIYEHQDSDSHQRSKKWLDTKHKKLGDKAFSSSSNSNGKMIYTENNSSDHRIVEAHLQHLTRYIKPDADYLIDPEVGLAQFYRSFLKSNPQFKKQYKNRDGIFVNRFKLNEVLVRSISQVMRDEVRCELQTATYVSLIFEDLSTDDLLLDLATTVRFIHPGAGGQLCERFLGFFTIEDGAKYRILTADHLLGHLDKVVQDLGLTDKLVSIACGGIAINNEQLVAFVDKLKQQYPRVIFTDHGKLPRQLLTRLHHCGDELAIFTRYLLEMDSMVASKRKAVSVHTKVPVEKLRTMTLSGLCTFLHTERIPMIKFFQYWYNLSRKERDELMAYWHFLGDFVSLLFTPFFAYLLKRVETLEDRVRKQFTDWSGCLALVDQLKGDLQRYKKENFNTFYQEAVKMVPKARDVFVISDLPYFKYGWSSEDLNLKDSGVKKRFGALMDRMIESTISLTKQFRFDPWQKLQFFNLVNTTQFDRYTKEFPEKHFESLRASFPNEFDFEALRLELSFLYEESRIKSPSVEQFLSYFTSDRLGSSFPEATKLAKLVNTIPGRIFAAVSQPRITSRQNLLEEYRECNIVDPSNLTPEMYVRCEWRLFRDLNDHEPARFHRAVVERFFELYEADQAEYRESDLMNYDSDKECHGGRGSHLNYDYDDEDDESDPENEERFAQYLEALGEADDEYFPFRDKYHYYQYQYDVDPSMMGGLHYDDEYLRLFDL